MRVFFLFILTLLLSAGIASGQASDQDSVRADNNASLIRDNQNENTNTKIFPVPVINNRFTITSDKAFVFVRLTNIIGQETTREKYGFPRNRAEISFSDVQKGIYLVTIEFEDKTRTVKKILIDSR